MARLGAIEERNPDTVSTANLRDGLAAMEARLAVQEAAERGNGGAAPNRNDGEVPYEARTLGRVGNLGWNTEPEILLARFTDYAAP